jgi:hypothetical protein
MFETHNLFLIYEILESRFQSYPVSTIIFLHPGLPHYEDLLDRPNRHSFFL